MIPYVIVFFEKNLTKFFNFCLCCINDVAYLMLYSISDVAYTMLQNKANQNFWYNCEPKFLIQLRTKILTKTKFYLFLKQKKNFVSIYNILAQNDTKPQFFFHNFESKTFRNTNLGITIFWIFDDHKKAVPTQCFSTGVPRAPFKCAANLC